MLARVGPQCEVCRCLRKATDEEPSLHFAPFKWKTGWSRSSRNPLPHTSEWPPYSSVDTGGRGSEVSWGLLWRRREEACSDSLQSKELHAKATFLNHAMSASPGILLEMQPLGPRVRPTTSEHLREGPSKLCFKQVIFWCQWKFANTPLEGSLEKFLSAPIQ